MRQVNFLVIFIVVLGLVLFSLENTSPAPIQIVPNVKVEAPIAVEIILSMGLGAVIAWFFSVWSGLQSLMELSNKNLQIQNLQETVSTLNAEIDERKRLVSASAIDVEVEDKPRQIEASK
ncbi:LapA family protein [Tumidithrix helvetica PCC 7403]|uniref:LapA family protein n=1 Tax=Tumidithrix helvetica TaxID=3457545 RepID=UPI003C81882D